MWLTSIQINFQQKTYNFGSFKDSICQVNFEENLVSNRTTELWIELQSGYLGNHN